MDVITFTDPALSDMRELNPDVRLRALKKIMRLETNVELGEALGGDLASFRKLKFVNRRYRVVYKAKGPTAEIWAVGARRNDEVYDEVRHRLDTLGNHPATKPLSDVIDRLSSSRRRP